MNVRQGDLLFVEISREQFEQKKRTGKRVDADDRGRLVLAIGEATGHAHVIDAALAELFEDQDGVLSLRAGGAPVTHEMPDRSATGDHDPLVVPDYCRVIRQREYSPQATRRASD